jgi:hypothetical protein
MRRQIGSRARADARGAPVAGQLVGMGAEPSRNLGFDGLP